MSEPRLDPALAPWAHLVLKDHVSLGGLTRAQLVQALALVWAALPQGGIHDEPGINGQLKRVLAGAAAFLGTDHVELRRWLVDMGWLQRDGYGREYRVAAAPVLSAELQAAAAPLAGLDVTGWVHERRSARQAEREQRRREWQSRQNAA
jgi:Uncharacterized protein conserved in bacteria (DUF2087)